MTFYFSQYPDFTDDYIQTLIWRERDLMDPEDIGYDDNFSREYFQRKRGGLRDKDLIAKYDLPTPLIAKERKKLEQGLRRPTFTFISGVGGAGKSMFLQPVLKNGNTNPWHIESFDPSSVVIHPDMIKRELGYISGDGLPFHEESMYLAEERLHVARLRRQNIVLVVTQKSLEYLMKKLHCFAGSGYRFAGHYIGMDPNNALRLAHARQKAFGNAAPIINDEEILSNVDNYRNFLIVRGGLSEWSVRFADSPGHGPLIESRCKEDFIDRAEEYVKENESVSAQALQSKYFIDYHLARELLDELIARGYGERILKRKSDTF